MDTAQLVASLLGAGGLGSVLLVLAQGLVRHASGAAGRDQRRRADAIAQRDDAWARLREVEDDRDAAHDAEDAAHRKARLTAEYASALRRQLHEAGVTPLPWPVECPDHGHAPPIP